MKEILIGLAAYNRAANEKLVNILRDEDIDVLKKDQSAFYRSIFGILEHITASEIILLRRFSSFSPSACLSAHHFITGDIDTLRASFHDDPLVLYATLAETDALMVQFTKELKESELPQRVSYQSNKGDKIERDFWNMIVHVLNHSTHHRGEISVLLDQNGISNDYSGFNLYTK